MPPTIKRIVDRVAYAKSGNAHNPTKTYRWDVFIADKCVGGGRTFRQAKELASDFSSEIPIIQRD